MMLPSGQQLSKRQGVAGPGGGHHQRVVVTGALITERLTVLTTEQCVLKLPLSTRTEISAHFADALRADSIGEEVVEY